MESKTNIPIFLVGSERSGTTLLRLMLDHHPQIAFNQESEFLVSQISDDGSFPDVGRYCEWLKNDRVFRHSGFDIKDGLDFVGLVKDFLEQKRKRDGKPMVGATIHQYFSRIDKVWPEAKYIYLLRDGRDVARSVMEKGWAGNVYVAADRWLSAETEWEHYRGTLPAGSWIELHYKDLIADPRYQLEQICRFLNVDYSERMFGYAENSLYSLPDPARIEQWKRKIGRRMLQSLEEKIGDRLLERGYELSDYPRIKLSGFEKKCLYWHSKMRVYIFRIRRFGLSLLIREFLARRLGLSEHHKRLLRALHDIEDAHIYVEDLMQSQRKN